MIAGVLARADLARTLVDLGDLRRALELADRAVDALQNSPVFTALASIPKAEVLRAMGRHAEANEALRDIDVRGYPEPDRLLDDRSATDGICPGARRRRRSGLRRSRPTSWRICAAVASDPGRRGAARPSESADLERDARAGGGRSRSRGRGGRSPRRAAGPVACSRSPPTSGIGSARRARTTCAAGRRYRRRGRRRHLGRGSPRVVPRTRRRRRAHGRVLIGSVRRRSRPPTRSRGRARRPGSA